MSACRRWPKPPTSPGTYVRSEVSEGPNELPHGTATPVALTPAGPTFEVVEGENELSAPRPVAPRRRRLVVPPSRLVTSAEWAPAAELSTAEFSELFQVAQRKARTLGVRGALVEDIALDAVASLVTHPLAPSRRIQPRLVWFVVQRVQDAVRDQNRRLRAKQLLHPERLADRDFMRKDEVGDEFYKVLERVLSPGECLVLTILATGVDKKQVAAHLGISRMSVDSIVARAKRRVVKHLSTG